MQSSVGCAGASMSHHGNEVEQVHARLVGFGVGKLQQRSDAESSSIAGIPSLKDHRGGKVHTQPT